MLNTIQVSTTDSILKLDSNTLVESNYMDKVLTELKIKNPKLGSN
jgi:hypothetical protein